MSASVSFYVVISPFLSHQNCLLQHMKVKITTITPPPKKSKRKEMKKKKKKTVNSIKINTLASNTFLQRRVMSISYQQAFRLLHYRISNSANQLLRTQNSKPFPYSITAKLSSHRVQGNEIIETQMGKIDMQRNRNEAVISLG